MQGHMASSPAALLTGSGKRDGRFGTAIAALGDINLDHYNGSSALFSLLIYIYEQLKNLLCIDFDIHSQFSMYTSYLEPYITTSCHNNLP